MTFAVLCIGGGNVFANKCDEFFNNIENDKKYFMNKYNIQPWSSLNKTIAKKQKKSPFKKEDISEIKRINRVEQECEKDPDFLDKNTKSARRLISYD